jgi:hypothetical protein
MGLRTPSYVATASRVSAGYRSDACKNYGAHAVGSCDGCAAARSIPTRRELIVGALPALFALHQFSEGFVWLGVRGQVSGGLGDAATQAWIVYAYAILPIIVPVGFMLLEPVERHRRVLYPFVALGAGAVNLVAVAVAATVQRVGFVSIWCLYAAPASILILEHFRRQRAPDRQRAQPAPA